MPRANPVGRGDDSRHQRRRAAVPPLNNAIDTLAREPASVARRAAARSVDFTIGVAMFFGLMLLLAMATGRPKDGTGVLLISIGATFTAYLLYEVGSVGCWGRTLGKNLMGIEVVRIRDGGRPGIGRSLLRNLVPTLFLVAFFPLYPLPYLLAAVIGDHRWPHDRLAGTCVVVRSG